MRSGAFFLAITAAQLEVVFSSQGAGRVQGELKSIDASVKSTGGGFDAFYDDIRGGAAGAIDALRGVADAMGAITLVGGLALFGRGAKAAWDQVDAVEQATIALRAYEQDARKVDKVLKDLLSFARSDAGKLFLRQELFSAAQAMKVAGAETENLTRYVEIMARSVSTGMATWNDLERVITRVGSTGRLTTIEFELLQQAGYQLDESLRNTTVTWEELFDALERGSVTVEGQTETIQGRIMSLNTAIRSLGTTLLGVDSETSQFIEGGLGDRLMGALEAAPDVLARMQPAAEAFGAAIVQVMDVAAGLISFFQSLPGPVQGAIGGIIGFTTAIGALRVALRGLGTLAGLSGLGGLFGSIGSLMSGRGFAGATTQATGFAGALERITRFINPVSLGLTALAAGGAAVYTIFKNAQESATSLARGMGLLADEIERLLMAGEGGAAKRMEQVLGMFEDQINLLSGSNMEDIVEKLGLPEGTTFLDIEGLNEDLKTGEMMFDEFSEYVQRTLIELPNEQARIAFLNWMIDLIGEIEHTAEGSNLPEILETIMTTPPSDVPDVLAAINNELTMTEAQAMATAGAMEILNAAFQGPDTMGGAGGLAMAAAHQAAADAAEEHTSRIEATIEAARLLNEEIERRHELAEQMLAVLGQDDPLSRWNLTEHATDMTNLAQATRDTGRALDEVLGIYGQIDAMGNRMSAAGGIADALFGPDGDPWDSVGPMRDVFDAGLISVEQFNAAIADGVAVQEAAAESELYLNKIRTDQLPILRETTEAYGAMIQEISEYDPQKQMVALGWMDEALQGQVQGFTDLVAEMQRYGTSGQEAIQNVIDGIVATNPVLTAMLDDLGLIEQQMDGSYTLSLDAGAAINDMQRLTASIDALNETLGGTPPEYPVDVTTSVNGQPTGPDGVASVFRDLIGNVIGDGAGVTLPITPSIDPGAADALRSALQQEPVTIPVQFDFTGMGGGAAGAASGMASGAMQTLRNELNWAVSVDTSEAEAQIATLSQTEIPDATMTVTVAGHLTAIVNLALVKAAVDAIPTSVTTWALVAGWTEAIGYLNGVQQAAQAIPASTTTWTLVANSTEAIGQLNGVQSAAEAIPDSTTTWTLVAGAADAIAQLNAVRAAADAVPRSITVSINAIGGYAAGASLGNSVIAGARDALGIASPSREFEEIGRWSAAGFERGWDDSHHTPSIGFAVDTPNYGAGFGAGGGGNSVTIAQGAVNITVQAETNADADEIATTVAERIVPALSSAVTQRRAGFGGVQA